jgi:hypothetical protein
MSHKVFTGGRAVVQVAGQPVGIYNAVSYSMNVRAEPIFTLGRYSANEITPTGYDAVTVQCSGFRVIDGGPHTLPKVPKLQDLLNLGPVTISVLDRQTNKLIAKIEGCIPVNYSTSASAQGTAPISVTYVGTIVSDESGTHNESAGATSLP